MPRILIIAVFFVIFTQPLSGHSQNVPSESELQEIMLRGRMLAEYDQAAWHATDAVLALKPASGSVSMYIARKNDTGSARGVGVALWRRSSLHGNSGWLQDCGKAANA